MRFLVFAMLMALTCAALSAQSPIQPGQLAVAPRANATLPNEASSSNVLPRTTVAQIDETPHDRFVNRLWITSIFAAIAGTSADAASSWGKYESNSLLASSNGGFGAKGVSIKAGVLAAVIIPQICLRKHKELKTVFATGNFAEAAIFTGAAIHNIRLGSAADLPR